MAVEFSAAVLRRARVAVRRNLVKPDRDHAGIWWVSSLNNASTYRVQADYDSERNTITWITCTCAHGLNKGAGQTSCYHAAAVLVTLSERHKRGAHGDGLAAGGPGEGLPGGGGEPPAG